MIVIVIVTGTNKKVICLMSALKVKLKAVTLY